MHKCIVCRGTESRDQLIDEVFKVDGRYVRVDGIPSVVCDRCGEISFDRETTERVRLLVADKDAVSRSATIQVYRYA